MKKRASLNENFMHGSERALNEELEAKRDTLEAKILVIKEGGEVCAKIYGDAER